MINVSSGVISCYTINSTPRIFSGGVDSTLFIYFISYFFLSFFRKDDSGGVNSKPVAQGQGEKEGGGIEEGLPNSYSLKTKE